MTAWQPRGHHVVLGVGRSGDAVARHLARRTAAGEPVTVTVLDTRDGDEQRARAEQLRALGAAVVLGATDVPDVDVDLVVASPGLAPHSPLPAAALGRGLPVVSEVEFASRLARGPIVAVTGTNGKTTTTSLVAHLLTEGGVPAEKAGNIGRPLIEAVADAGPATVLVVEVSSFQLTFTDTFHPKVSLLLNITPDHLDWHGTMERYAADKAKVFANQGDGDVAVIDVDDPGSAAWADPVEARGATVVRVSRDQLHPGGASVVDGVLTLDTASGPAPLVPAAELPIRGEHNVSNALAAAAAAHALGVPPRDLRRGLLSFRPIEHRLEPVETIGDVEYFNDSKATNPDSVFKALTAFDDRGLVVLLGGRNKGNDFGPLAVAVAERCRAAVVFGEAAEEIARAFEGTAFDVRRAARMCDAVAEARSLALPGDVVLLSPACASFDEFSDYEDRGRAFKRCVAGMRGEGS